MGQILVGTASWTDKTLIASGWYPPEADTPEKRLRFYARQFPLVEVDATYYALPAEQTARSWAERTPAGFTFNVYWPRCNSSNFASSCSIVPVVSRTTKFSMTTTSLG